MAHDDYYNRLHKTSTERLMRTSHAMHEADTCAEALDQLAHVVGHREASAISAYFGVMMAHHELQENKA